VREQLTCALCLPLLLLLLLLLPVVLLLDSRLNATSLNVIDSSIPTTAMLSVVCSGDSLVSPDCASCTSNASRTHSTGMLVLKLAAAATGTALLTACEHKVQSKKDVCTHQP
jgi:hypothetical protein